MAIFNQDEQAKAVRKKGVSRSKAIEDEILHRMSEGEPLAVICRSDPERFPAPGTWNQWCQDDPELSIEHARARDLGFDAIAQDCLDIADDNGKDIRFIKRGEETVEVTDTDVIQRSKLRVETRLKLLAKWDPKRYGDKIDVTSGAQPLNLVVTIGGNVDE